MHAYLTIGSARHLGILHVRGLKSIWIYEPGVDEIGGIGGILGLSSQNPRQHVVENGIGHGLEITGVVDEETIWVEHAISIIIRTLSPDCEEREMIVAVYMNTIYSLMKEGDTLCSG